MLNLNEKILTVTDANRIKRVESVQNLWSGYGEIKRYFLEGGKQASVIVKHIQLPESNQHPKGWNTNISHDRKLKSYQVEKNWYHDYGSLCNPQCRVPKCYTSMEAESELLLIMEDLDINGFPIRITPDQVSIANAKSCLTWLAHFHAQFLNNNGEGLWPIGTYWHLDTRPEEWEKIEDKKLKSAAMEIDERLKNAQYQTLVHGDAKLANFCFGENIEVAAVDFQYVGRGIGMKDVAYFISSCFEAEDCEKYEEELLAHYFNQLQSALSSSFDFQELKKEWMTLYPFAWADFYRFLEGWSPGHWKQHAYSRKLTNNLINELRTK